MISDPKVRLFFPGVKGDFDPPRVSRILGRKKCGNFLPKKLPHILRPKILLTLGGEGSKSLFTPEKKAPLLDPKSYMIN